MKPFGWSYYILATLLLLVDPSRAACGAKVGKKPCRAPHGLEAVLEVQGEKQTRLCCNQEDDDFKELQKQKSKACYTIACGESSETCAIRFVNKKEMVFNEIVREPCAGGKTSLLCCREDSSEYSLSGMVAAEPNEFPHQVRLPGCGGTIYNEKYIVTAAHCVVNETTGVLRDTTGFKVLVGTSIGNIDPAKSEFGYQVEKIIVHKEYSKWEKNPKNELKGDRRYYNDIALLKLEGELDLTSSKHVKALEIAPKDFDPFEYSDKATMLGWGDTGVTVDGTAYLSKGNILLRKDEICYGRNAPIWNYEKFSDKLLCLGGVVGGTFSMMAGSGDSGGPAICRNSKGHPVLCGISSFKAGDSSLCKKEMSEKNCYPSTFVQVSHFFNWIQENTNTASQDPNTLYRPYLYGEELPEDKHDHQVYITSKAGKKCGGTLIAGDLIVTAAHCVADPDTHSKLRGLTIKSRTLAVPDVKAVHVPDSFKMVGSPVSGDNGDNRAIKIDNNYESDLAVVELTENVDITEFPTLPKKNQKFAAGTGLSFPLQGGMTLRSKKMKLLEPKVCQHRINRVDAQTNTKTILNDNIVCAIEEYSGGSTCDRVLGGGLICGKGAGVLCGVHVQQTCKLTVPYGYVNMGHAENLEFVQKYLDARQR